MELIQRDTYLSDSFCELGVELCFQLNRRVMWQRPSRCAPSIGFAPPYGQRQRKTRGRCQHCTATSWPMERFFSLGRSNTLLFCLSYPNFRPAQYMSCECPLDIAQSADYLRKSAFSVSRKTSLRVGGDPSRILLLLHLFNIVTCGGVATEYN